MVKKHRHRDSLIHNHLNLIKTLNGMLYYMHRGLGTDPIGPVITSSVIPFAPGLVDYVG